MEKIVSPNIRLKEKTNAGNYTGKKSQKKPYFSGELKKNIFQKRDISIFPPDLFVLFCILLTDMFFQQLLFWENVLNMDKKKSDFQTFVDLNTFRLVSLYLPKF